MDTNILRNAEDKKFSDFSDAVKQELKTKLANNPKTVAYSNDYDKIQQMKSVFAKINSDFGNTEPEEPIVEPVIDDDIDDIDPE